MRTEVVTLCLEKVGRNNLAAVSIEEGESSAERGSRNAPENGLGDDTSPAGLGLVGG